MSRLKVSSSFPSGFDGLMPNTAFCIRALSAMAPRRLAAIAPVRPKPPLEVPSPMLSRPVAKVGLADVFPYPLNLREDLVSSSFKANKASADVSRAACARPRANLISSVWKNMKGRFKHEVRLARSRKEFAVYS